MGSLGDALRGLPHGWASDVEVLARTGSDIEDHGDHLIVRTPDNPGYRWGNLLVVREPGRRDEAEHWVQRFSTAFPDATHRSIGLPAAPDAARWSDVRLRVESEEVLGAASPPHARPLPSGYEVRRLSTGADWSAAVDLEVSDDAEAAAPAAEYRLFAARRWQSRAAATAGDRAAFFGAFRDGSQVAHLGIVRCADHARYQSVLTTSEHRGRGLASHLLGVAGAWAAGQGAVRWRILVDPGSPAARLYRSVGFAFDSLSWQVTAE